MLIDTTSEDILTVWRKDLHTCCSQQNRIGSARSEQIFSRYPTTRTDGEGAVGALGHGSGLLEVAKESELGKDLYGAAAIMCLRSVLIRFSQ